MEYGHRSILYAGPHFMTQKMNPIYYGPGVQFLWRGPYSMKHWIWIPTEYGPTNGLSVIN